MTTKLYLVPIEQTVDLDGSTARGPKYFAWSEDPDPPGIPCPWALMDYGFMPTALLIAHNIAEADAATLAAYPDVYAFPTLLTAAIAPGDQLADFCEAISIPTDWTTPSTTYLELLRCLAGIFQFMQRYGAISSGQALLGGAVTLSTRYRNLTTAQKTWFDATLSSFGYDPGIVNQNSTLRQMLKQAGDAWGAQPFYLGGLEF